MESQMPHQILSRPKTAKGTFLRILTINDVYKLETYPHFAAAVDGARAKAASLDCVVASFLPGDFLSPSVMTALDQGRALMKGFNLAKIDYACLGNHEFDIGFGALENNLKTFPGTLINSNIDDTFMSPYPPYKILDIGSRKAVIGGFLTEQMDIYPPSSTPKIRPINEACLSTWELAKKDESLKGSVPDLFIPMTHQLLDQDRDTAVHLAKQDELATRTPYLLGAHDHEVYIVEAGNSQIVKVGLDCERIGVIDIWWTEQGERRSQISMVPCDEFPKDPEGEAFATERAEHFSKLMRTRIAKIPQAGSTKKVRFEESFIPKWLLSWVKRGLNEDSGYNVEVSMMQAGAIRGKKDYEVGPFRMEDLYAEFAFDLPIGVVSVPGWVIAESVHNTRSDAKPAPQFLHLDEDCTVVMEGEKHVVTHLNGAPIVADKMYSISIWNNTLHGVNDIQPMMSWLHKNGSRIPEDEACRAGKDVVIKTMMRYAWRHVFNLDAESYGEHGNKYIAGQTIGKVEVARAVDKTLGEMDKDGDGKININELYNYMEKEKSNNVFHGCEVAEEMMKMLGVDSGGVIGRDAILATVGRQDDWHHM